jgi:hypothetical protein
VVKAAQTSLSISLAANMAFMIFLPHMDQLAVFKVIGIKTTLLQALHF